MNLTDISPFNYYSAPSRHQTPLRGVCGSQNRLPDTKHPSPVSARRPSTPHPIPRHTPPPRALEIKPLNLNYLLQTPAAQTKQAFKETRCVSALYAPEPTPEPTPEPQPPPPQPHPTSYFQRNSYICKL